MDRMRDKVVIVTGGGGGIGRATSARVSAEGGIAIVADLNLANAEKAAKEIRSAGGSAQAYELDVTSRPSWEALVAKVLADWNTLDGLVNNAGLTRDRSLLRMSDDEWRSAIDVNLTGAFLGCQHVIPTFKEKGSGAIVNLSSESRNGEFGQANYASAKAGIIGLTRTVALEHSRHGIRTNAIAPGTIDTPMVQAVPEEIRQSWLPNIPLGRIGMPEEVAAAIVFLLSDDASYVNGHTLNVDGGSS